MHTYQQDTFDHRVVTIASAAGATLVCFMVGITLANGVGFQDFESLARFNTVESYNTALVDAGPVLRMIYPLDTTYILAYTTMTYAMVKIAKDAKVFGMLALIAAFMTGLLDFIENNHILSMLTQAEINQSIDISQVTLETVITQTKFNFGLMLTLALSFLIPSDTRVGFSAVWLARALVIAAPVALLAPATTLLYITMNVVFGGLIATTYACRHRMVARVSAHSTGAN